MSFDKFISDRAKRVPESGIRRIFNLASSLEDPINLSIGQPDFDVPDLAKQAAINAITQGHNGYTVTAGLPELREKIGHTISDYYDESPHILICSGVSGGLLLSLMAILNPSDEVVFPDPYFVSYPNLIEWLDGRAVPVQSYPFFELPLEGIEQAISSRTKAILICSPNNPTGVVYSHEQIADLCALARKHDLLIISDEIYCQLCYDGPVPSAIEYAPERTLLLRGFGKSYGMTGWRMAYIAGPSELVQQMGNMQQYTFVCAPSIAQHGALAALDVDMSEHVDGYRRKRDYVRETLSGVYEFSEPSGGFYFFLKVPSGYSTGTAFVEAALQHNLLCVPGGVFSQQDTHFRISYAVSDETLKQGCAVLQEMAQAAVT